MKSEFFEIFKNEPEKVLNVTLKHYKDTSKIMLYKEDFEVFEKTKKEKNLYMTASQYIRQGQIAFIKEFGLEREFALKEEKTEKYLREQKSKIFNRIYDLISCNDFDYFATFTISPNAFGVDRLDLESVKKRLRMLFQKYNQNYNTSLKYVATFEEHKKGGWHLHSLISGIDKKHFRQAVDFKTKELMYDSNNNNAPIYNCTYFDKLGWNTFKSTYGEKRNIAMYLTKYITKDLTLENFDYKAKYMRSRNLNKPLKESDFLDEEQVEWLKRNFYFFENNYFKILELPKKLEIKDLKKIINEKIEEENKNNFNELLDLFDSSIIEFE